MERSGIKIDDAGIITLAQAFAAAGRRLYIVGGWVRNALLGLPAGDIDVASDATGEEVAAFPGGFSVTPVNRHLGTVLISREGFEAEYTCFRSESYSRGHSPDTVRLGVSMAEDARRRDFAVNALYLDILSGEVLDPTGRGLEDITLRRLRSTTEDPADIMRDDGLRLLRLARFSAEMGLSIAPDLFAAAKVNAALIDDISPERIFAELSKILLADTRHSREKAQQRGLLVLHASGVLERIIPELAACAGLDQRTSFHRYSVLMHIINTVASVEPALHLRLAALLHDIAKPVMLAETGRFIGHDKRGAELARERLLALRAPGALVNEVAELVCMHMYDHDGRAREAKVRRFAARHGRKRFLDFIALREADTAGSGMPVQGMDSAAKFRRIYADMRAEGAPFSLKELAVSGRDISEVLGIPPSREVGELLGALLMHAAVHPQHNTREALLRTAHQMRKQ